MATDREPDDWWDRAACAGLPTSRFYPDPEDKRRIRAAKRICAQCPVRAECLNEALALGDIEFGIRAGLPPRERRKLHRQTNPQHEAEETAA
ncbi:WhiB family transcriptional regulator [Allonocardiopsis opalescens]|uniref:WhiB family redox-sensing transcriptional regulator n=1 Tax=Allonocardiopsis opalescens TaxID=1144618 RepID=A0A2T0PP46_9ACTN|nr:WhiB family transcriptional regulator [Allonocardiopsis opalescens]PRX90679.1 WhiB family redox-sensing transcriptional regulator [Allonocardiopsis opalescens]